MLGAVSGERKWEKREKPDNREKEKYKSKWNGGKEKGEGGSREVPLLIQVSLDP